MKKIILILLSILFASNVYAHSTKGVTPDFDYKQNCTKKNSVLNYISKHKLYRGDKGEIIKFNSYTAFDVQNVMSGAYKKNPIEITGQVLAIDSGQNLNWQTPDIMGGKE